MPIRDPRSDDSIPPDVAAEIKSFLEDINDKLDAAPAREDARDTMVRLRDEAQIEALSTILEGIAELKVSAAEQGQKLEALERADTVLGQKLSRVDGDVQRVSQRVAKIEKVLEVSPRLPASAPVTLAPPSNWGAWLILTLAIAFFVVGLVMLLHR